MKGDVWWPAAARLALGAALGSAGVAREAIGDMKAKLSIFSTGLVVLGIFLGVRACMFATNRWTYDDSSVLPLLGASAAAIIAGVYFRFKVKR